MKFITIVILSALTIFINNANSAEFICEKKGRFWRPKNEAAKTLAKDLRVKTCDRSPRFEAIATAPGNTWNVVKKAKKLSDAELKAKYGIK